MSLAAASLRALVFLGALAALSPAFGAEWYAAPGLELQSGYDQNPRFLFSNPTSTDVFVLMPKLELGAREARWAGRVIGAVHLRRYPRVSELNRNDKTVNVFSHYDMQRLTWRLDGAYTQTSILGTTQPPGVQTGLVQFQSQIATGTASPSLTWQITPRDQLRFGYTFQDISYQDAALLGLSDYRYHRGSVTYQHDFSSRLQLFATPSYSVFDVAASQSQPLGFQSSTAGLQLGLTRVISPTLTATVAVGGRRTTAHGTQRASFQFSPAPGRVVTITGFVPVSNLNTGVTVNASVTKHFERGSLYGSFTRALTPSGLGNEVETNALDLVLNHNVTSRLSGSLTLDLLRARSLGTTVSTAADRDWARLSPSVRWRWTRRASLTLSYAYTWLRAQPNSQIAHDNVIYLTLSYQWPRIPLFR